jgi:pyridoxal phosphate enzyme (YggS family)
MSNYINNFDAVLAKIEAARLETDEYRIVKIIAASKYVGTKEIEAMYNIGQRSFGENRVQELKEKSDALEALPIEWHFIGRLQSNKINHLLEANPFLIHSCESLEMAQEIDKRAKVKGVKPNLLLQINSANEASKAGVSVEEAEDIYHDIQENCNNVALKGIMSIGAHTSDEKVIAQSFEKSFKIFEKLQKDGAQYCSMGMSNDFELAIKCGSNMVRLGSILFQE